MQLLTARHRIEMGFGALHRKGQLQKLQHRAARGTVVFLRMIDDKELSTRRSPCRDRCARRVLRAGASPDLKMQVVHLSIHRSRIAGNRCKQGVAVAPSRIRPTAPRRPLQPGGLLGRLRYPLLIPSAPQQDDAQQAGHDPWNGRDASNDAGTRVPRRGVAGDLRERQASHYQEQQEAPRSPMT